MAERLVAENLVPQLLLSSPASRALNTALIMSRIWGIRPENLQIHDSLYTSYANKFLDIPLDNLPTAGVVIVTLESENWGKIGRKLVKDTYVDYPKRK